MMKMINRKLVSSLITLILVFTACFAGTPAFAEGGRAAGIAASGFNNKFTGCTNSASIRVSGGGTDDLWTLCGITAGSAKPLASCRNTSEIKYVAAAPRWPADTAGAAGIAYQADMLTGCKNSGKVSVDTSTVGKIWSGEYVGAAGVACRAFGVKRCANTGALADASAQELSIQVSAE